MSFLVHLCEKMFSDFIEKLLLLSLIIDVGLNKLEKKLLSMITGVLKHFDVKNLK